MGDRKAALNLTGFAKRVAAATLSRACSAKRPANDGTSSVRRRARPASVAQVIAAHDGNIDNIRMERQSPDFTALTIDLEVYDLKHLTAIIAQLRAKPVLAKLEGVTE